MNWTWWQRRMYWEREVWWAACPGLQGIGSFTSCGLERFPQWEKMLSRGFVSTLEWFANQSYTSSVELGEEKAAQWRADPARKDRLWSVCLASSTAYFTLIKRWSQTLWNLKQQKSPDPCFHRKASYTDLGTFWCWFVISFVSHVLLVSKFLLRK